MIEDNLLEKLVDIEVPPIPENLDRQMHRRLNDRLLATHLIDIAVFFLSAAIHFSQALFDLVRFSLTGVVETGVKKEQEDIEP